MHQFCFQTKIGFSICSFGETDIRDHIHSHSSNHSHDSIHRNLTGRLRKIRIARATSEGRPLRPRAQGHRYRRRHGMNSSKEFILRLQALFISFPCRKMKLIMRCIFKSSHYSNFNFSVLNWGVPCQQEQKLSIFSNEIVTYFLKGGKLSKLNFENQNLTSIERKRNCLGIYQNIFVFIIHFLCNSRWLLVPDDARITRALRRPRSLATFAATITSGQESYGGWRTTMRVLPKFRYTLSFAWFPFKFAMNVCRGYPKMMNDMTSKPFLHFELCLILFFFWQKYKREKSPNTSREPLNYGSEDDAVRTFFNGLKSFEIIQSCKPTIHCS